MICPICLYGCKIWATCLGKYKGKLSIENKFDDLPPEKLLLSYNRIILGAKKNTSNVAVHGELGEYPLYISAMGQAIKY